MTVDLREITYININRQVTPTLYIRKYHTVHKACQNVVEKCVLVHVKLGWILNPPAGTSAAPVANTRRWFGVTRFV